MNPPPLMPFDSRPSFIENAKIIHITGDRVSGLYGLDNRGRLFWLNPQAEEWELVTEGIKDEDK